MALFTSKNAKFYGAKGGRKSRRRGPTCQTLGMWMFYRQSLADDIKKLNRIKALNLICCMSDNPGLTAPKLAKESGMPRRTVYRKLKKLSQAPDFRNFMRTVYCERINGRWFLTDEFLERVKKGSKCISMAIKQFQPTHPIA